MSFHEFAATDIDGREVSLADYRGRVLLVVNVASACGYTPQYEGLERLYRDNKDRGFSVLGFPCNQFGAQEPGTDAEIKSFCTTKFSVTFPMFSKIHVLGASAHPAYDWLTAQASAPEGPGRVAWNFTKFVIGKDGQVVGRFGAATKPEAPDLLEAIADALAA